MSLYPYEQQIVTPYPNSVGVTATNGNRVAFALESAFPRNEVANLGLAGEIGKRTLIACRLPSEQDGGALKNLTAISYTNILFVAHAIDDKGIAAGTRRSISTVKTQLHDAYSELSVSGRDIAACFIPLEESIVRVFNSDANESHGPLMIDKLSGREEEIFKSLGEGYKFKQIARRMTLSVSSIRSHANGIYNKFGLPQDINKLTYIRRLAGALANIKQYDRTKALLDSYVKPHIGEIVEDTLGHSRHLNHSVDQNGNVATITNNELLQQLENAGYVPSGTTNHGRVTIIGKTAAMLFMNPRAGQDLLTNFLTRTLVRQLIEREVAVRL